MNNYNRSDLSKVNRIYSSQVQKTRKIQANPDYRDTEQNLKDKYDAAFNAYNLTPNATTQ